MGPYKVVALLSGGKDSVYTLHHAVLEGHSPVALASLVPPEGKDELDSFMYQTVGSSGLHTLAEALALPLVTHTIRGTARNQRTEYGSRAQQGTTTVDEDGDETEDLWHLLTKVKAAHPDVEAVVVGAILSNYQRVRVEHVCARLGLVPLAYLWERDQKHLLAEMVHAGIDSVLVKVAGAGLGVEHLGRNLAQMQPTLLKLNKMYDTHPCGEGGEYETFTLDAPLFLRRVQLDKTTLVLSNPDPRATVAHWHLDALSLGPLKPEYTDLEGEERWVRARELCRERVRVPRVLEAKTERWERRGRAAYARAVADGDAGAVEDVRDTGGRREVAGEEEEPVPSARRTADGWLYLAELVAPKRARGAAVEIEDEVRGCFDALIAALAVHGASLLSLAHLTVYLSPSATTMSLFPRINAVYASYFGTSPPTRACVAVPGSGTWRVKIEAVARVPEKEGESVGEERRALHVQSVSYWAPANIGPYSQSILTVNRLFTAGQIPLLPSSLSLPPSDASFAHHASLALQHAHRIARASRPGAAGKGGEEGAVLWLAPAGGEAEWRARVRAGAAVWRAAVRAEDEDDEGEEEDEEDEHEDEADDEDVPPFVAVEAAALPRGAAVEWQVTFCGGGTPPVDYDEEDDDDDEEGGRIARAVEEDRCIRMEIVSNTTARPVVYHRSRPTPSLAPGRLPQRSSAFAVLACSLAETQPHPLPGLSRANLAQVRAFYRASRATAAGVRALACRVLGLGEGEGPALSLVRAGRLAVLAQEGENGVCDAEVVFVLVGLVGEEGEGR